MPINSFLYPGVKAPPPFEVANSVRLDDGSSDNFSKTNTSGNSDTTKFTVSLWFKKTAFESNGGGLFMIKNASNNTADKVMLYFLDDKLNCFISDSGGSTESNVVPNRVFRDSSAWTHLTYRYDSTQGTDSNRVRIYINGTQETSLGTANYPDQNHAQPIDDSTQTIIGKSVYSNGNTYYFDGYMCEAVLVNGQSLDPTSFGEFDEDSPTIWKPIDVSGLTFGNDGFYLDFEDSSNLGNDVSGGTDLTENNIASIDQSTDTCTNNYCVLNPLEPHTNKNTFSEGNIVVSGGSGAWHLARGTIGLTQGKWYWEVFFSGGTVANYHAGVQLASATSYSNLHSQAGTTTFYNGDGGEIFTGSSQAFTTNDYGTMNGSSDILGVALNMDDKQITFYKNGSAIVTNYSLDTPNDTMMPLSVQYGSSQVTKVNFGGTQHTAISSGNSDANGYGNFEYSVPSGYYSINSKNLAEFG